MIALKNPNLEILDPKQVQITKIQMTETIAGQDVLNIRALEFKICFAFRYPNFGFNTLVQFLLE